MKIALVLHDYDPGFGQGRYALELARFLAREHEVHILSNTFESRTEPGTTWVSVPARRSGALTTIISFMGSSERILRRPFPAYDIVHAQGLSCWNADVVTAHICNAARSRFDPPKTLRQRLFAWVVDPLEKRFYRTTRARHLIAISRRVADDVRSLYQWHRPMTILYHGVCSTQILDHPTPRQRAAARESFHLAPEIRTWLFSGEARKGLEAVIRQLARHTEVQLLVVSRSDTSREQSLADRMQVGKRVVFAGALPTLKRALIAADVFVYPSAYDAFGLVVAEAMGAGLPVVAGVNTGASEWIQPGVNGLTCDPDQPSSLGIALDRIETDIEFGLEMGKRARDTASDHDWDRCAAATERVYESLMNRSGTSRISQIENP